MAAKQDIVVQVGGDTSALETEMKKGTKSIKSFGTKSRRELGETVKNFAKLGAAAVAAAAVMAGVLLRSAIASGDEIKRLAQIAGAGVKEFQRLSFGAKQLGISEEKLGDILKDVNDRVGDFMTTGAGPMADFFEKIGPKIGITAAEFRNLSGPQALQLFMRSLEKANITQAETTFFLEAMASDLTLLMPLYRNNAKMMKELGQEADKLGLILDEKLIDNARKMNIDFNKTVDIIGIQLKKVFLGLAPVISIAAKKLAEFLTELAELRDINKQLEADTFGNMLGRVQDRINAIQELLASMGKSTGFSASLDELLFGDNVVADLENELKGLQMIEKAIVDTVKRLGTISEGGDKPAKPGGGPVEALKDNLDFLNKTMEEINESAATFKGFGALELSGTAGLGLFGDVQADMVKFNQAQRDIEESRADEKLSKENAALNRQREILEEIQNPLAAFKQRRDDILAQTDEFENAAKLSPIQANEAIAKDAQASGLNLDQEFPEGDPARQEDFFRQMEARIEFLREFVMSEEELEIQSHERRLVELRLFKEEFALTEDERRALQLDLEAQHQTRMSEIVKRGLTEQEKFKAASFSKQTSTVLGEMVNITNGVARENKALFEINKQAATAQAVISAYEGISLTMSKYPFPLSIALAGLQAVAAFAQVRAIQSQTFGGGGGAAPSIAGSTAAPPVSNVGGGGGDDGGGQNIFINLRGQEVFGPEAIRQLVKEINEAQKNGSVIQVN